MRARSIGTGIGLALVLCGLVYPLLPHASVTYYTPYSLVEVETYRRLSLGRYAEAGLGWLLFLVGSMVFTLSRTPRRFVWWPWFCYLASIVVPVVAAYLVMGGMPRRYHYYYAGSSILPGREVWGLAAWFLVLAGLLLSLVPMSERLPLDE